MSKPTTTEKNTIAIFFSSVKTNDMEFNHTHDETMNRVQIKQNGDLVWIDIEHLPLVIETLQRFLPRP